MRMNLPRAASQAMKILRGAGHQAYIVGGSVRDELMGKQPDDFDITTSALPEEVCDLFSHWKLSLNGLKHGTVRVIKYGQAIEITTFRVDGEYEDGRHPDEVLFTGNLFEDVQRRDFTVNSMCWSEETGLIDYMGGQEDIKARLVRCVSTPVVRFQEDALRVMRALRFSSTLDFDIEAETAAGIHACGPLLRQIAVERIWMELKKLLTGARVERLLMEYRDVMQVFLPALSALDADAYMQACRRCALIAPVPALRLCALVYDLTVEEALGAGAFLRISKADMKVMEGVLAHRGESMPATRPGMRRLINGLGEELTAALCEMAAANSQALCQLVIQQGDCVSLRQLALNGEDVYRLGVTRRGTGQCLSDLLGMVMDGQVKNEREALKAVVRNRVDEAAAAAPQPKQGRKRSKRAPVATENPCPGEKG